MTTAKVFSFLVLWSWFSESLVLVFWQSSVRDNTGWKLKARFETKAVAGRDAHPSQMWQLGGWRIIMSHDSAVYFCIAIVLFLSTRKFVSLCLSSLKCINGCCRHTVGGNQLFDQHPFPSIFPAVCTIETGYASPVWASLARVSTCFLIFCVANDWSFGKTSNKNLQLVLQHCCRTSWKAMLSVLPPTFKPVNNLICCKIGLIWVVKRATRYSTRFAALFHDKLHDFCRPFFCTFSPLSLYESYWSV